MMFVYELLKNHSRSLQYEYRMIPIDVDSVYSEIKL